MDERHSHRRLDRRSLAMHRVIAAKLRAQPELIAIALANLDRWEPEAGRSAPYIAEWRRILAMPVAEIAALLEEESERMDALRQAGPFAGVLTARERWKIYDAYSVGAYHPGSGDDRR